MRKFQSTLTLLTDCIGWYDANRLFAPIVLRNLLPKTCYWLPLALRNALFMRHFQDVATRPEIYFLLARFASRDDRLSVDDLSLFLESEQGEFAQAFLQLLTCLSISNKNSVLSRKKVKKPAGICATYDF